MGGEWLTLFNEKNGVGCAIIIIIILLLLLLLRTYYDNMYHIVK